MTAPSTRRQRSAVDGILLLDKPMGVTSNRQLQLVRNLFNAKKAGHTGTLDPLATGMLPLCFGHATKMSAFMLDADKTYVTDARLGVTTDSGDADGRVLTESDVDAAAVKQNLSAVIASYTGTISQIPPMHSAIKQNGQPLYKLARQGITVERAAREVVIHELEVLQLNSAVLRLRVHCSKGTYIRTLVEDIGQALGCGAHVASLRRTWVSPFQDCRMVTPKQLEERAQQGPEALSELLLPVDYPLQHLPVFALDAAAADRFCQGQSICLTAAVTATDAVGPFSSQAAERVDAPRSGTDLSDQKCRIYSSQRFLGLAVVSEGQLKPYRVLHT